MMKNRYKPGIAYYSGRVIVAGGNMREVFDIESLQWPFFGKPQWSIISIMETLAKSPYYLVIYNDRMFLIR